MLEISNSTVSRYLKLAQKHGYVKIKITQPNFLTLEMERRIMNNCGLKSVKVIPDLLKSEPVLIGDINDVLIEDLRSLIKKNTIVGVCWGRTLNRLAEQLKKEIPVAKENVKIVQLNGGASRLPVRTGSTEILQALSDYFDAESFQICAPAYVDRESAANILKAERQIKSVLEIGKQADIAIFSAGDVTEDSLLFRLGCLETEEIERLKEQGAVGDICSHFLKTDGTLADIEIDRRAIALSVDQLKRIPEKILVVYGTSKEDSVSAALKSGLVDRLYIDEDLAEKLIRHFD